MIRLQDNLEYSYFDQSAAVICMRMLYYTTLLSPPEPDKEVQSTVKIFFVPRDISPSKIINRRAEVLI